MKQVLEIAVMVVGGIVAIPVLMGVMGALIYPFAAYSCSSKAEIMGVEHSTGLMTGCMIKVANGQWIDMDKVQIVDLQRVND